MNPRGKAPTPIRSVLRTESALTKLVADGLNALEDRHRSYINAAIRTSFSDSLEIDNNLKEGHDQENRWDYLLGHSEGAWVVGLEPHSAKDDQVSKVILKRKAALQQLKPHLKEGAKVAE